MQLQFNEVKTTQAAVYLLKKRGGRMSYMKLIKLLYLADREGLLKWGRPVTFDHYVSMDNGPVLSETYERIMDGVPPGQSSFWADHISSPKDYEVALTKDTTIDELSDVEMQLLDEVFEKHGHKDRWEVVKFMHELPEWTNPNGSAIPITYRDILKAGKKTEAEIAAIESELESLAFTHAIFDKK